MTKDEAGWYDKGTEWVPALTTWTNNTGQPIHVLTEAQEQARIGLDYIRARYGDKCINEMMDVRDGEIVSRSTCQLRAGHEGAHSAGDVTW